ncbi:unnamed protein product [Ranitomeya imitator]|uniref:Ig-like domain-containing protein n=1 Tax=Ranitomeya imitator TaxID=111125 RepID=A0ABN9LGJ0_9NEOB|nr:unnamed protein product [Ranitomeya imitator]
MLSSLKPMTPFLECPLHGQQLSIAHIIITLSRRKLPGKEGAWFHHRAIRTSLRQNSPCSNLRSINLDLERKRNIWLTQHRGRRKTTLQLLKSFHSSRRPIDQISTLLGQIGQWFSNTRKIADEATIKISKAQELLQTFQRCRLSPTMDGLDLNRILLDIRPQVKVSGQEKGDTVKLHCQVYGFHPRAVDVKWMKNKEDEVHSYETTHVLPNPDGTYQIRVSAEVTPKDGDRYSCYVDHRSLEEPLYIVWEPEKSSVWVIAVVVALVIIAVFGIGGFIFYKIFLLQAVSNIQLSLS